MAKLARQRKADAPGGPAMAVAVIGAGWAGCAAAVELARSGHQVTLFEAARTLGGRARRVSLAGKTLDNGQHILLGAYSATFKIMRTVGLTPADLLLNLPLQMRYPDGAGGMDFVAPRWPAPLHLAAALLRCTGLGWQDKLSLARFSTTARWMDWRLHVDCSVNALLQRFDQTDRLTQLLWRPLCLAALNTPPERASAQVFLNVLRDSLGARRSASDMLLPTCDLSALFPDAAAGFVSRHGGVLRLGSKVSGLQRTASGQWLLDVGTARLDQDAMPFDGVVVALPAHHAASLLRFAETADLATGLQGFAAQAISTCYLQYDAGLRLEQPFFALLDDAASGHWGQFVFDRGQLDATQAGLLAVVVSASGAAAALEQAELARQIAAQLAAVLRQPALGLPQWSQVITEKRATFACTPGLQRPLNATALPGLVIAGDYTASDYPATIESAVRSGVSAAAGLFAPHQD